MRARVASPLIVGCVVAFVALELVAMRLYPGGTFWDPSARGARFWQNFLCDLESDVALDGEPNVVGARVARAAMLTMVLGFAPFWWTVPRLFVSLPRLGSCVRALGLASLAGIVAVTLMPSSRYGYLHGVAVIVAGLPGLSAAALAVVGLARAEARPRVAAAIGAAMLASAGVDFALYARTMVGGGPGPRVLPIAQKLALILLLAWMVVVAWRAAIRETRAPS
ncbi:MAG TPA: hypothetical protein VE987_06805 [Polyangiaceae bacterium]|nr:hypothetical protein [Polyangiaceae bacterium]